MSVSEPLKGYRVIDVTQNVAGPFCTQILGDLGADVIKIEPPNQGDPTREWEPPLWNSESVMFLAFNRSKRSLVLDLKSSEGRELLTRLLRNADILVHSLRPNSATKLQLDAQSLAREHPNLLVAQVTAFGSTGPLRNEPGYDPILQAVSGMMSTTGFAGSPPARIGTSIVDMGTGLWCALSVVAALLEREKGGTVRQVEASLFSTALAWLPYQIAGYFATGVDPQPWGSELAMLCPYGAYETRDHPIMIAVGNERLWNRLCQGLRIPSLEKHPDYRSNAARVRNREKLRKTIEHELSKESRDYWLEQLQKVGVPAGAVNSVSEALVHPQTEPSHMLEQMRHPEIADLRLVRLPLLFDGLKASARRPPPTLGEHSISILEELGMTPEEIDGLMARNVVQPSSGPEREG